MTISELFHSLAHETGYYAVVSVVALAWVFHMWCSRTLHGSNLYWEEMPVSTRWSVIVCALGFTFIPYLNLLGVLYFAAFYGMGLKKYLRRRAAIKKANSELHEKIMKLGYEAIAARGDKNDAILILKKNEDLQNNRAEIIVDPQQALGLNSQEAMMERYIHKVLAHAHKELCKKAGVMPFLTADKAKKALESVNAGEGVVQELWAELMAHYRRLDMKLFQHYGSGEYNKGTTHSLMKRVDHLAYVIAHGINIVMPDQLYENIPATVKEIHRYYPDVAYS